MVVADYEIGLLGERCCFEVAFYESEGVGGEVVGGVEVVYYGWDFGFGGLDLLFGSFNGRCVCFANFGQK